MHEKSLLVKKREELAKRMDALRFIPEKKDERSRIVEELHTLDRVLDEEEELPPLAQEKSRQEELEEKLSSFKAHLLAGRKALLHKRKFFEFIFGRHPHAILAICCFKAEQEIEPLIQFLTQKECYEELVSFLNAFRAEVQKKWNPHLYKGGFLKWVEEFEKKETLARETTRV